MPSTYKNGNGYHEPTYREARFSWSEVFSDAITGKTSSTILAGLMCIFTGLIGFMLCFVLFFIKPDVLTVTTIEGIYQSIILISIGAALLGVRNLTRPKKMMDHLLDDNHDTVRNEDDFDPTKI